MNHSPSDESGYRFDGFHLLPGQKLLLRGTEPVDLTPRAIGILIVLAERFGRVVSRDEILDLAFPGVTVEPGNITVHINQIRKVLGQAAIATVPGIGYRFNAKLDPAPDAVPLPPPETRPPSPLPLGTTTLIGRETELDELRELIRNTRLVTITGAGGVGKTRLALALGNELVAEFPNGVRLVDLAPITGPGLVETALLTALTIVPGACEAPLDALLRWLGAKRVLLIIDNCEYVADNVAALIATMVARTPHLKLVATSQVVLGIAGETIYRLDPLALPPMPDASRSTADAIAAYGAVQLFTARARAADRRFRLDDANAASVAAICRTVDGIPLALEMAAARLPLLGIDGLRDKLAEPQKLLTTGPRNGPTRHRTLEAMLEWSYGLLEVEEQCLFRRLGIFRGSFTLEAALTVGGESQLDEWSLTDLLGRLIDKSMVVVGTGDPPRYRLLETLRLDAGARLRTSGERDIVAERHAVQYIQQFDRSDLDWQRMQHDAWIAAYASELDDARAALDWAFSDPARTSLAVALAGRAGRLWHWLGLTREGQQYVDRAVDLVHAETSIVDTARLLATSATLWREPDRRRAMRTSEKAIILFRLVNDPERLGLTLTVLGADRIYFRQFEEATVALEEARQLLAGSPNIKALISINIGLARVASIGGDKSIAKRYYFGALDLTDKESSPEFWSLILMNLGVVFFEEGDIERSIEYTTEAMHICRQRVNSIFLGEPLYNLATYLALSDRSVEARRYAREALWLLEQRGGVWLRGLLELWALLAAFAEQYQEAAKLEGFVDADYAASGEIREPNEQTVHSRILKILAATLSKDELANLHSEGASWTAKQAVEFTDRYII
jgi:predicted ATPase/DNA-binding winged helix-turn-helix (wHTH) protein